MWFLVLLLIGFANSHLQTLKIKWNKVQRSLQENYTCTDTKILGPQLTLADKFTTTSITTVSITSL